jgi:hypothetical protein
MPKQWEFKVANPSPYARSDYVQVDLEDLQVPADVGQSDLRLLRLHEERTIAVPFQIDRILGDDIPKKDTYLLLL